MTLSPGGVLLRPCPPPPPPPKKGITFGFAAVPDVFDYSLELNNTAFRLMTPDEVAHVVNNDVHKSAPAATADSQVIEVEVCEGSRSTQSKLCEVMPVVVMRTPRTFRNASPTAWVGVLWGSPPLPQGRIRMAVCHRRRGGSPLQTIVGKKTKWENLVGPFLAHKILGLRPPPPPF